MPDRPIYASPLVGIEIDPDQKHIFHVLVENGVHPGPEPLITCQGSWKAKDRDYFFNHPGAISYNRPVEADERITILELVAHCTNSVQLVNRLKPSDIKNVMVLNVGKGFRLKAVIDDLRRKPELVASLVEVGGFFRPPIFLSLLTQLESMTPAWEQSLQVNRKERE